MALGAVEPRRGIVFNTEAQAVKAGLLFGFRPKSYDTQDLEDAFLETIYLPS